jgi:phosphate-selective porin OprO/OprP
MKRCFRSGLLRNLALTVALVGPLAVTTGPAAAADKELLDILLSNGVITKAQHEQLMKKDSLTGADILGEDTAPAAAAPAAAAPAAAAPAAAPAELDAAIERKVDAATDDDRFIDKVAQKVQDNLPVKASYGDKGFRLETSDGNFRTELQWRAQLRYWYGAADEPRQVSDFESDDDSNFEARRLRMKIGGHGYRPWLKYYFEVDLQPARDVDDDSESSDARVIDWRIDLAKWEWAQLRLGQWKIDLNRERVDSSGRQQFVERSIVNRIFTIDRQVGVQLRGHLFANTFADMRYWAGMFTGEGRGVLNDDSDLMYMGRLQWNFLGRDLDWKQTDVEYTEEPTGSLAFGAATNEGRCTRWSSSGCGNLDGFAKPGDAMTGQFQVDQMVEEFAFKWRGFSAQQEFHWKTVKDREADTKSDLTGAYAQAGYFFHHLLPVVPEPLELAFRYAFVEEPNKFDRSMDNLRQEFTVGANWFFNGHNNKITLDYAHLTLDDDYLNENVSDDRVRLQYDVSF